MAKIKKTNALRLLDQKKISYEVFEYDVKDGLIDGVSVANKVGKPQEIVYKTLVCKTGREGFVFIIPVGYQLNLKKAAKAAGVKKVEMLPLKDLLPLTGYIHGGCSPIGMKKQFPTYIHNSVNETESIVFSAGLVGLQVEVGTEELGKLNIKTADLC